MKTKEKKSAKVSTLQPRTSTTMKSPWHDMEQWFDEFGRQGWLHPFTWEWPREIRAASPFEGRMPKVDMIDREGEILIRAELPGVKKDDVEISLTDQTVTLEAHTEHEHTEEKEAFYRREMSRGDFQRTLSLPCTVDDQHTKASFTDGVLELTLPKLEKTSGKKVRID